MACELQKKSIPERLPGAEEIALGVGEAQRLAPPRGQRNGEREGGAEREPGEEPSHPGCQTVRHLDQAGHEAGRDHGEGVGDVALVVDVQALLVEQEDGEREVALGERQRGDLEAEVVTRAAADRRQPGVVGRERGDRQAVLGAVDADGDVELAARVVALPVDLDLPALVEPIGRLLAGGGELAHREQPGGRASGSDSAESRRGRAARRSPIALRQQDSARSRAPPPSVSPSASLRPSRSQSAREQNAEM